MNGVNILNGNLTVVGTQHFSAAGNDYEYIRDTTTSVEIVSTTGPLVNPLTIQVCVFSLIIIIINQGPFCASV